MNEPVPTPRRRERGWGGLWVTAADREVTTRLDDFPRDPQPGIGDRLTIRYDPDRPDVTLGDVRDPPDYTGATIFLISLSAALAAAAVVFFSLTRRRRP